MQPETKATVEAFSYFIQDKSDLYKAMLRNGWYLPHITSSLITEKYLADVASGSVWCPKYQ
jgi:hypothetical protein